MSDLVSIIIPIYNTEDYLKNCFDSIILQDYVNWEAILIDDGSTDKSLEICEEYASKDKRFSVIHQENRGVSAARNKGLREAKGNYICFIDSDDSVSENFLSHLLFLIKENNTKIAASCLFPQSRKNFINLVKGRNNALKSIFDMKKGIRGYIGGKMFCADIIKDNNLFFNEEYSLSEDTMYIYEYISLCDKMCSVVVTSEILYKYNSRQDSATSVNFSVDKLKFNMSRKMEVFDFILNNTSDKSLQNLITLVKVSSIVSHIHIILRTDCDDAGYIKTNLNYIRKNLFYYLICKNFPIKKKLKALVIAVVPFLLKK